MLYLTPPEELPALLEGEPPFRARQLEHWLYRHPVADTSLMTNLGKDLRERLGAHLWPFQTAASQEGDGGKTRKWLFRTPQGNSIETVAMGYPRRTTICISSQAGCAMGCTFCATGQFGFERHLEAGEIVAQVAFAWADMKQRPLAGAPDRVTNVVFMGMGEPLANYRRTREALRRMIETMGMSPRSITVSTVGIVPGIRRLAAEPWPVNLAVSLHATTNERRSRLVPINDRYPIEDLIESARDYFRTKGRRISIEWTLIKGKNDDAAEARRLADIARKMHAHVNVIPLNPTPLTEDEAPGRDGVSHFMEALAAAGANATLRDTRGVDIDAACGQLRARAQGSAANGDGKIEAVTLLEPTHKETR